MDFGMNARNYHWPQMREKALRMPAEGNGKTKTAVVGGSGHPAYQKQGTPCVHSSNVTNLPEREAR